MAVERVDFQRFGSADAGLLFGTVGLAGVLKVDFGVLAVVLKVQVAASGAARVIAEREETRLDFSLLRGGGEAFNALVEGVRIGA